MSTPNFRFKQFTVWHDRCAMKVGTDGVLLGAWCTPIPRSTILDIGTGSGLIALMLAQRCPEAHVDAIDIVPEAIEQATYNFTLSPWSNRLAAHLCAVQDWQGQYDLIVSNPPYFVDSLKNPDKGRELARHTDTLSYTDLLTHSARLLKETGTLALVLPASTEEEIIHLGSMQGLFPTRLTHVFSKPGRPTPIRILIEFNKKVSPMKGDLEGASFYIESAHSPRSEEYAELTKDFYL
ncbi:MAG: methyltransferase [Paludibacteraceae bacterium]|nr:methyltransferase [Paludibacteraceae bacterium]